MKKKTIGQNVSIQINRIEGNFDRAMEEAYQQALYIFGCDSNGHLNNIKDSNRSTDSLIVEFKSYKKEGSMSGQNHTYEFISRVERSS